MKASKLILELNKLIEKHGDLHVVGRQDGFGGHAIHLIDEPSERLLTIKPYDFEEAPEAIVVRELFPELNSDELFDEEGEPLTESEVKCIEISFGSMIYST